MVLPARLLPSVQVLVTESYAEIKPHLFDVIYDRAVQIQPDTAMKVPHRIANAPYCRTAPYCLSSRAFASDGLGLAACHG